VPALMELRSNMDWIDRSWAETAIEGLQSGPSVPIMYRYLENSQSTIRYEETPFHRMVERYTDKMNTKDASKVAEVLESLKNGLGGGLFHEIKAELLRRIQEDSLVRLFALDEDSIETTLTVVPIAQLAQGSHPFPVLLAET